MTVFTLCDRITAVQTVAAINPNGGANPVGFSSSGSDGKSGRPAGGQAYTLYLTGVGSCSATVQPVASNDGGVSWAAYTPSITVTAASADVTPGTASSGSLQTFDLYGAYVTAISGTSAAVTCRLSI